MTTASVEPSLETIDALIGCEALCLFIAEDDRPLSGAAGYLDWRMDGGLSRVLLDGFFTGAAQERLLLSTAGRIPVSKVFAVGLGREGDLDVAGLAKLLQGAAAMLKKAGVASVAIALPRGQTLVDEVRVEAVKRHFLPGFGNGPVTVIADRGVRSALGSGR